jgi:hypothetical protein
LAQNTLVPGFQQQKFRTPSYQVVMRIPGRSKTSRFMAFQLGGDGLQVLGAAHAIPVGEELISTSAQGGGKDQARIFAGMQIARIQHRLRGGG